MKKKRLDRDLKWGFQHFPYYQMRVDLDCFHGLVCLIKLTAGEYIYWNLPKSGKVAVAGKGMSWLQLIPDDKQRLITAKYLPDNNVSVWYVDVIEGIEYADDGVIIYEDKYLDVYFTPRGDIVVDDKDELDAAYHSGELTKEQYDGAILECDSIVDELCSDVKATERICTEILEYVNQRIADGERLFKEVYSKCGMRCDLCLIYRPNVEANDRREEICKAFSKMWQGFNPDSKTIICDGCSVCNEKAVLFSPNCKTRQCVLEKNLEHCGYCNEYPCAIFPAEPTEEENIQKIEIEKQWTWEDEKLMEAYACKKNMDEFRRKTNRG